MGRTEQIVDQGKAVKQMDLGTINQRHMFSCIVGPQPIAKEQPQRAGNTLHVLRAGAVTRFGNKALRRCRARNRNPSPPHRRMWDADPRLLPHDNDPQRLVINSQIIVATWRVELTCSEVPRLACV